MLCTPPAAIPETIAALGARGTRGAIVITAGLSKARTDDGRTIRQAMLDAARPHLLRILGPNTVGLLVPGLGLNASFAPVGAAPGSLALVAQSGAICTVMLDWAAARGIGFSHFISLGDSADVDFGDAIDFLASDPTTRAILLYIESITDARKFMSATRAAARNKPVIALKVGRVMEGARAAASHTGALAGADNVYDAALRRAGALRVGEIGELFDAAETLAFAKPMGDGRLAIVTNGGGPGVLAVDAYVAEGGKLAVLSDETIAKLDKVLPAIWPRGNPVDIVGDAPGSRYREALGLVLDDAGVDVALVMYSPTAVADAMEAARVVADASQSSKKGVLTCWLGEIGVQEPRRVLAAKGLPTYETPERAVRGALHVARFHANQAELLQLPAAGPDSAPDGETVRGIIAAALASGTSLLSEHDAKRLIAAAGIPVASTEIAANAEAAVLIARRIGYPVALKILSPDITHKTEVGGIALDIVDEAAVRAACDRIVANARAAKPGARLEGFTVQKMIRRAHARELIVGASVDATFGPTILFGEGGVAVEAIADTVIGLPPLNGPLARAMIGRTRIARRLAAYRDVPAVDVAAIEDALVRVGQLIADHGEIAELDINPLLADVHGVIALDARVRIARFEGDPVRRLAIRPYPRALEHRWVAPNGSAFLLRPIRPEDEAAVRAYLGTIEPRDAAFAFFGAIRDLSHSELARVTQIDYDREMTLVAVAADPSARATEIHGLLWSLTDPDNERCEFTVAMRANGGANGLPEALIGQLIRHARAKGTGALAGSTHTDNTRLIQIVGALGFSLETSAEGERVRFRLDLTP